MVQLTYDPTPADQPEFNEAEQEAMRIGEQALADQNQMLAGKFKDAEALEQAYIELQKKLGESNGENAEPEEVRDEEEQRDDEEKVSVFDTAAQEWNTNGKLTDETIEALSKMDSGELVKAYLDAQSQNQPAADLSESDVTSIQQVAGGAEGYQNLITWASENMPQDYIEAFDSLVETGNRQAIQLAVRGLRADFEELNGHEGQMLTGKATANKADVFRSQAEVVQAMADPRYDRDPAYRQDVFAKLERSNLNY